MDDITVEELRELLQSGKTPVLIDVREPYEHAERNIGGENLPLGGIPRWKEDLQKHAGEHIVLYCQTGNRSGMAASFLRAQGMDNVSNLLGGVVEWFATSGE